MSGGTKGDREMGPSEWKGGRCRASTSGKWNELGASTKYGCAGGREGGKIEESSTTPGREENNIKKPHNPRDDTILSRRKEGKGIEHLHPSTSATSTASTGGVKVPQLTDPRRQMGISIPYLPTGRVGRKDRGESRIAWWGGEAQPTGIGSEKSA